MAASKMGTWSTSIVTMISTRWWSSCLKSQGFFPLVTPRSRWNNQGFLRALTQFSLEWKWKTWLSLTNTKVKYSGNRISCRCCRMCHCKPWENIYRQSRNNASALGICTLRWLENTNSNGPHQYFWLPWGDTHTESVRCVLLLWFNQFQLPTWQPWKKTIDVEGWTGHMEGAQGSNSL